MMRSTIVAVVLLILAVVPAGAANWKWDFDENFVGGGIADADWTIDKVFPGTKLILDMRFIPKRELHDNKPDDKMQIEDYWATVEADMQWGETGLEYGVFAVNAFPGNGTGCARPSASSARQGNPKSVYGASCITRRTGRAAHSDRG